MSASTCWLRVSQREVTRCEGYFPLAWLMDDEVGNAMLVRVDPSDQPAFDESLYPLMLRDISQPIMHFLTLRKPQGPHRGTYGPPIASFACNISLVRQYVECGATRHDAVPYVDRVYPCSLDVDCYQLTAFLMDVSRPTPAMRCTQLPYRECAEMSVMDSSVEWMIPHRGRPEFLDSCLSSLRVLATSDAISVALDEPLNDASRALIRKYTGAHFLQAKPLGNGPGAMLDRLARASAAEYVLQQDSDDLSCIDRRDTLLRHLVSQDLDIASSHEVSVDDAARQVQAVRCALELGRGMHPGKPFSYRLPIAAIRRQALLDAGGFSDRPFAQDSEFLFRAVVSGLRIGGVDEFLFVRRRHAEALSVRSDTGMSSSKRQNMMRRWMSDFDQWRKGTRTSQKLSFSAQNISRRNVSLYSCNDSESMKLVGKL